MKTLSGVERMRNRMQGNRNQDAFAHGLAIVKTQEIDIEEGTGIIDETVERLKLWANDHSEVDFLQNNPALVLGVISAVCALRENVQAPEVSV
jgi:hypothetical protein